MWNCEDMQRGLQHPGVSWQSQGLCGALQDIRRLPVIMWEWSNDWGQPGNKSDFPDALLRPTMAHSLTHPHHHLLMPQPTTHEPQHLSKIVRPPFIPPELNTVPVTSTWAVKLVRDCSAPPCAHPSVRACVPTFVHCPLPCVPGTQYAWVRRVISKV